MRAIIEALVSATNLALMIREEGDSDHRRVANTLLAKLDRATARLVALKEAQDARVGGLPKGNAGQSAV